MHVVSELVMFCDAFCASVVAWQLVSRCVAVMWPSYSAVFFKVSQNESVP